MFSRKVLWAGSFILLPCLTILAVSVKATVRTENDHCDADRSCSILGANKKYSDNENVSLIVITVATERTEGYDRFLASAHREGLKVETLGMDEEWRGGDVLRAPGGGHKVNLLRKAMEKYRDRTDLVIMFVDSYDVIFTGSATEILSRFSEFAAGAVFSAEGFCWPDASLSKQYPEAEGKKYLNSGGFIGYAPEIYKFVTHTLIKDEDDDQLFYTKIYLDPRIRESLNIRLDSRAHIFQNLNGAVGDVNLTYDGDYPKVRNNAYGTYPIVIHGNGASKVALNSLANYVAGAWKNGEGCLVCSDRRELSDDQEKLPKVTVGIFIEEATPFFAEFLAKFLALDYPKARMSLFIHRAGDWHNERLRIFFKTEVQDYAKVEVKSIDDLAEWKARNAALQSCLANGCEYYLNLDSLVHLENTKVLQHLIAKDRLFIAPMVLRSGQAWSNFWGALSSEGYYARSHDYMEIVTGEKRGIWNVPFVNEVYLVKASILMKNPPLYVHGALDPDMAFCRNLRDQGVFMWVDNLEDFGFLINPENFDYTRTHPDFYEIYENQRAWEQRYIHAYYQNIFRNISGTLLQPCTDVYWFPIASPTFCRHLIEIMEAFGKWSDGTNSDPRLAGGYENVPTRDIHMRQVGLEPQWLYFLREYVRPVQEHVFTGYFHDPPKAIMNFVVRYRPDEQPALRPHHDASTYTINLALNQVGVDFEGGGSRFIRYNCSVTSSPSGWALLHPGRLTHYHEGLRTTNGTRYIMVSFVDP